jgi:hypothetical protein
MDPHLEAFPLSTDSLFESALARLRRRTGAAVSGAALIGGGLTQAPLLLTGCADTGEPLGGIEQESWSTDEGQRNTTMVSYLGSYWMECKQPNSRFGCGNWELYAKVRIRAVEGVDLNWKKVGLTYRLPYDQGDHTAVGHYFSTDANGDEEWHVPVSLGFSQTTITFDVWYQDGAGHTYVDDNQGELHVIAPGGSGSVLRVEPWLNTVAVTDAGVAGRVSAQLADLDYDKDVVLLGTVDGWQTVIEIPMGAPGEPNKLYWQEDLGWAGAERWQVDLDLPGVNLSRFEYVVGYAHGVVNGARRYEFWDNNGGSNYIVERPVVQ